MRSYGSSVFLIRQLCKDYRIVDVTLYDDKTRDHLLLTGNCGGEQLVVALNVKTVATLDRVFITGVITPTQELSVGATAKVVILPRSGQTMQSTPSTLTDNPISF